MKTILLKAVIQERLKKDLSLKGFCLDGSSQFHHKLHRAFGKSTTISGYPKRIAKVFKETLVLGNIPLDASSNIRYLVDGSPTSNLKKVNDFRKEKLKPANINFYSTLEKLIAKSNQNFSLKNSAGHIDLKIDWKSSDRGSKSNGDNS